MPVLIKDFSWSQTRGLVSIIIPLKAGVPRSDVDLFLAREYFKLSHPVSHVLELFLLHAVEPSIQKVEFVDGGKSVCVDLKKLEVGKEWTHLEKCLSRPEKSALRQAAHAEYSQAREQELRAKREADTLRQRRALEKSLLDDEEKRERRALEILKAKSEFIGSFDGRCKTDEDNNDESRKKRGPYSSVLSTRVALERDSLARIPPPRTPATIEIQFTDRKSITPKRDTQEDVEAEAAWRCKTYQSRKSQQQQQQRTAGEKGEVETDVEYLLKKGANFFHNEDFESAIEIFSYGIKMHPKHVPFYSNRSACYLKVSNHHGAIQDCSKALELLDPPVEANAKERIKAHVRRATSLVQLGMIKEALGEFDEAIKINGRRKTDDDDNDDTDALEADREKILRMLSEKQAQT